ncbi:MAG TPA: POT family MFS transporter [Polyangiales bacterium]|nr:POT family MFS transporter [Polyangiales bacterium]
MAAYRQTPEEIAGMPKGVPYIVGNELAERFSFYGMKTILVVFMTHHLKNAAGDTAPMNAEDAKAWYHAFSASAYFFPMLGAILSDAFLGKYRTIMSLSIVYCLGHLALALDETKLGLTLGLTLIAIGSGGIKPCVSAHVGDQFGKQNQNLLERVFGWFYFSINFGSFFSTLLTPVLLESYGPRVAFGLPGVFMLLATIVFWLGRNHFAHIPPAGAGFVREVFSVEGAKLLGRVIGLVLFIAMFWALYDQNGSAWVLQAERMDLEFLGHTWLPSQVQAINPILVMILIPFCSYLLYPAISKVWPLTSLRKIGIGFFLTVLTFLISAHIETRLDAGDKVNIGWQLFAFAVLTLAEVLVYGTGLEFFYAQAPNRLKSLVMALFLLSVSLGNVFTALVNVWVQNPDGSSKLAGPSYYLFFAGLMFATSVLYIFYAAFYRSQRYVQGMEPISASGSG